MPRYRFANISIPTVAAAAPPLRGRRFCYYHGPVRPRPRRPFPDISRPRDVQAVLSWLADRILRGAIDTKAAGQILYCIQQVQVEQKNAARNRKNASASAEDKKGAPPCSPRP